MIKPLLYLALFTLTFSLYVTTPLHLEGAYDFSVGLFGQPYLVKDCETHSLTLSNPIDACEPPPNNINQTVVLVQRGSCTFVQKARNLQKRGAIGMIVINSAE